MRRKDFGIKLLMNVNLQAPSLDPSQAPFDYVCSLKSKGTSDVQAQQRIPSLYFESKGFCSDLDEGKCSYIILRAMTHAEPAERSLLRRIMLQTQRAGDVGKRHKHTVLAILEKAGSLKQVTEMLHTMEKALIAEIQAVEDVMGVKNPRIRELFQCYDGLSGRRPVHNMWKCKIGKMEMA
ncbi:hypothetical protein PoMZ_06786 [Pyricularia oryzae]|nr:hypothetical protein PoMZ_06786 [Pyricularia oryzae]